MNYDAFIKEYNSKKSLYEKLEMESKYVIDEKIKENGIKIHSVCSRIKELNSLFEKSESNNIDNPFNEIYDILGLRIICLF